MYALIVHGGAGQWPEDRIARGRDGVGRALDVGLSMLANGDDAIDVVEQVVQVLEDDPTFNAGTGSCANTDGEIEMDSIIVDGHANRFGAVAALRNVRHPVSVARLVMESTPHCFLVGDGATRFAHTNGFDFTANSLLLGEAADPISDTVGAVALDERGRIAAATSTGGTRGKMPGRVGDSPIFGSGAYADRTIGVSATGVGEYLMRALMSKTVAEGVDRGLTLDLAIRGALAKLEHLGGNGGVIALDANGHIGHLANTSAMPVAYRDAKGTRVIGS